MHSTPYQRRFIHIHRTITEPSCFGLEKFTRFQISKTSVNKRLFYVCLRKDGAKVVLFCELTK